LRIVFVSTVPNASGGIRAVASYARLLSGRGHEVTVVSTPPPSPSLRSRIGSLVRGRGWSQSRPRASHLDGAGIDHRLIDRHRPITDSDLPDADVVIATWWLTAEWVASLSQRKGAKVHFVQGHESDIPGQPEARVAATWRLPLHRIVCSRWLLELAKERYGDSAASLVPNGVDLDQFSAPPRDKQARPTVGFVYSPAWIKGCDVARVAYELAYRRFPGLRLVCFGSTPVSPMFPLPPQAEFTLLPSQSEIPSLYASCDAWLWPSRREGFGLPILEAMACRTPVIAAPAGAARELLANGGGVLLAGAEPSAMANAIERVCGLPPADWRDLSAQARVVATRHGWDHSATLFEAALELAIERNQRAA
jgi:glycosyltransferase involved in cell wall biosynthesis